MCFVCCVLCVVCSSVCFVLLVGFVCSFGFCVCVCVCCLCVVCLLVRPFVRPCVRLFV